MVIDTSAILAILQDEPERRAFNEAIGTEGLRDLNLFFDRAGVELAPVDVAQAREARLAFSRFGKGRHSAGLNYGDCFAYALARVRREPLLFKGADFSQTDAEPFSAPSG